MKTLLLKQLKSKKYLLLVLAFTLSLIGFAQNTDILKTEKPEIKESGSVIINNKTYFYTLSADSTTLYYNRFGQEVNSKGEIISKIKSLNITELDRQKLSDSTSNSGKILINNKVFYYFKDNNNIIKYYDQKGNEVNKSGKPKVIIKD